VEALSGQAAERPKKLSFVASEQSVRVVFHHRDVSAPRNFHDRVHLTSHACVVDRHSGASPLGDEALELALIEIESVWADVDENRLRSSQCESVGAGHKGERRDDHLVSGLEVEKERAHLQRMRA